MRIPFYITDNEIVIYYPCSGNDFKMIKTINENNLSSKDFIYCDSGNLNANVGVKALDG